MDHVTCFLFIVFVAMLWHIAANKDVGLYITRSKTLPLCYSSAICVRIEARRLNYLERSRSLQIRSRRRVFRLLLFTDLVCSVGLTTYGQSPVGLSLVAVGLPPSFHWRLAPCLTNDTSLRP